jgi:hypothetical protein
MSLDTHVVLVPAGKPAMAATLALGSRDGGACIEPDPDTEATLVTVVATLRPGQRLALYLEGDDSAPGGPPPALVLLAN